MVEKACIYVLGDGKGGFNQVLDSGFLTRGNVKDLDRITIANKDYLLVSRNNDTPIFFRRHI